MKDPRRSLYAHAIEAIRSNDRRKMQLLASRSWAVGRFIVRKLVHGGAPYRIESRGRRVETVSDKVEDILDGHLHPELRLVEPIRMPLTFWRTVPRSTHVRALWSWHRY